MPQPQNPGKDKVVRKDIDITVLQYPSLQHSVTSNGRHILEGQIELKAPSGAVVEFFSVKLVYSDKFPFAYPTAFEFSGKFDRNDPSMHINIDGSLCLNSEVNEIIESRYGLPTPIFIEKVLLPNLAWRVCKKENIDIKLQEFGHGTIGLLESYKELLNINDDNLTITCLKSYLERSLPARNQECVCGSKRKFKSCHGILFNKLNLIPGATIAKHADSFKSFIGSL